MKRITKIKTGDTKLRAHFIPNSHLDREWTLNYQQTRKLTVEFLDTLLDIMEKNEEYTFCLDSQTVPLEDYLEIRPQNREQIKRFVQSGRLNIGPWYTAPDCNITYGESVVRNLLMGHKVAAEFGEAMKVGYTPFGFNQPSQLPQIYAGFGIDTIFFYRGISNFESTQAEFIWQAPDGTVALCSRFGSAARYNFYMFVWRPVVYGGKSIRDRVFDWQASGVPFKLIDESRQFEHYFQQTPVKELDETRLSSALRDLINREKPHFTTPAIPFMQGMDSTQPDSLEIEIVNKLQKYLKPGEKLFFSMLPKYVEDLKASVDRDTLKKFQGEMRYPGPQSPFTILFGDMISARPRQKIKTMVAENILHRLAEPFSTIAYLLGEEYPEKYLEQAWKYLLQCHPHDTIAGCGIDALEEDAMYRLNQTIRIADTWLQSSLGKIQLRIGTKKIKSDEIVLTVFNPSPYPRSEVVTAYIDIPNDLKMIYYSIFDDSGNSVPMATTALKPGEKTVRNNTDLTMAIPCQVAKTEFWAENIPALGYKTYIVRKALVPPGIESWVSQAPNQMENEFLNVTINSDGTITLLDKSTGQTYPNLHYFIDEGEAGTAWQHRPLMQDQVISSLGSPVRISLVDNSHLSATFRVDYAMQIPARFEHSELVDHDNMFLDTYRSEDTKPLRMTSYFTLQRKAKSVEVKTIIDNQSKSHRVRVMFPTGLSKAKYSDAESQFDVCSRIIDRDKNHPFRLTRNPSYPMLRFVDVSDSEKGFGIITKGIHEYEVMDNPERTLAITLLRAFKVTLCTVSYRWEKRPEQELSQSLGHHEFEYIICPHIGNWEKGDLFAEAERLHFPLLVSQTTRNTKPGKLPLVYSFISIQPKELILSAFKKAEYSDNLILRIYNPTDKPIKGKINLAPLVGITGVQLISMEEKVIRKLKLEPDDLINLTIPKKKIVSIELLRR
jgi:mannosylglycerate hydrolase